MLVQKGYSLTDDEQQADAVVVNTCCFIGDAKEESIHTILEMAQLKAEGKIKALLVTGCLAQRYFGEIQKEIPEVDAVLGTTATDSIVEALEQALAGKAQNYIEEINKPPVGGRKRVMTTGGGYAYLKIAEGCDKHCTYCIIPKVRGGYRSIPMEELLKEAKELVSGGARELILVAQETTLYGVDLYGYKALPKLLWELCRIPDLQWIRVLYCYPEEMTPELVRVIKEEEKVCHYLDMPVQSGSDTVLKRMGRKTDTAAIRRLVKELREEIPDICIRTTLIAGFPGETKAEHEETLHFIKEMEFDRLGVFPYSREEDTPAAKLPQQVSKREKHRRAGELMELQQEIAFAAAERMKGRRVRAVIEGWLPEEQVYIARTYKDAPAVDGYLFLDADRQLMSGDFVEALITGANEYDLIGELIDESAK